MLRGWRDPDAAIMWLCTDSCGMDGLHDLIDVQRLS